MSSNSQDLIFTLYGDYLRHRGGEAWIGSLIEVMSNFDLTDQAVRSTLSRMSQKGWLKSRKTGRFSYYSQTSRMLTLLEEGAQRIFQPRNDPWDGRWHLLTYSIPESKRHLRRRLQQRLRWLGFGTLNHTTWISTRDLRAEVGHMVSSLAVRSYVEYFSAEHRGFTSNEEIVERCWDLEQLNNFYADFINRYQRPYQEHRVRLATGIRPNMQECFRQRFMLTHEYRSSPYVDPNLPLELLPEEWLGQKATQLFQEYHDLLYDGAKEYLDAVLAKAPTSHS